jgi:hypothetical protein
MTHERGGKTSSVTRGEGVGVGVGGMPGEGVEGGISHALNISQIFTSPAFVLMMYRTGANTSFNLGAGGGGVLT